MLVLALARSAVFSGSSGAQTGLGGIGRSGAQVAGAAIGVGAVTVLVLYVILRKASITGGVQSANGTTSLMDKKHNLNYKLVNTKAEIKPGEQVQLFGKKKRTRIGISLFE
jgi:hypothetical protein